MSWEHSQSTGTACGACRFQTVLAGGALQCKAQRRRNRQRTHQQLLHSFSSAAWSLELDTISLRHSSCDCYFSDALLTGQSQRFLLNHLSKVNFQALSHDESSLCHVWTPSHLALASLYLWFGHLGAREHLYSACIHEGGQVSCLPCIQRWDKHHLISFL